MGVLEELAAGASSTPRAGLPRPACHELDILPLVEAMRACILPRPSLFLWLLCGLAFCPRAAGPCSCFLRWIGLTIEFRLQSSKRNGTAGEAEPPSSMHLTRPAPRAPPPEHPLLRASLLHFMLPR